MDGIDTRQLAAPFGKAHHYAASMPVARLSVGLYTNGLGGHSKLVGVCVFSHPVNNASVPKTRPCRSPHRLRPRAARDRPEPKVATQNRSSWLGHPASCAARNPKILSVISYADPVRRTDEAGRVFLPGHVGSLQSSIEVSQGP